MVSLWAPIVMVTFVNWPGPSIQPVLFGCLPVLCSEREGPFFVPSPATGCPERAQDTNLIIMFGKSETQEETGTNSCGTAPVTLRISEPASATIGTASIKMIILPEGVPGAET
jgi:hypothetical protein